jgi:hypothetical protein
MPYLYPTFTINVAAFPFTTNGIVATRLVDAGGFQKHVVGCAWQVRLPTIPPEKVRFCAWSGGQFDWPRATDSGAPFLAGPEADDWHPVPNRSPATTTAAPYRKGLTAGSAGRPWSQFGFPRVGSYLRPSKKSATLSKTTPRFRAPLRSGRGFPAGLNARVAQARRYSNQLDGLDELLMPA